MTVTDVVGITLGILSIMGILLGALGWWINTKIKVATYHIQPNANGGKSLADLHKKVDAMCLDMQLVKSAVTQLEDEMDQLEADVEGLYE